MDERNPSDWVSYAQYLDLNRDDIERAQEEAFAEAERYSNEADEIGYDVGRELQANQGTIGAEQTGTYGAYREAQRKSAEARARVDKPGGPMDDMERAARGLVSGQKSQERTTRDAAMALGSQNRAGWWDKQKALGATSAKNLNYTRDRMDRYAKSKDAAKAQNMERLKGNWMTYGTYGVQDDVDEGRVSQGAVTKNAWSVRAPGESLEDYYARIDDVYARGRKSKSYEQSLDKGDQGNKLLGVGLGIPIPK